MQCKDFADDRVEKLTIFSYGQPKDKSKGYRAYTILETSNMLQSESQWADLNIKCELIRCLPHPVFISRVGACRFISKQSDLIVWHNAFNSIGRALYRGLKILPNQIAAKEV